MWDFIIQRELNKTVIGMNKKKIHPKDAGIKLNNLIQLTKTNVIKGKKRELKKSIFKVKKQFKL